MSEYTAVRASESGPGEDLRPRLRGQLLRPGDQGFDESMSLWNGMADGVPELVVRCRGSSDVVAAVRYARANGLPVSAKGGGHGVSGAAVRHGGLLLDLSAMDWVRIDPASRRGQVGPGARWGDLDREAQAFGLATTGGVDSRTGIAGLTLGGGLGWLARSFGLACDNLVAADVVTAEGELVRASDSENTDLMWALRGGGANFGVVTSFEFSLHALGPEVTVLQAFHPIEAAGEVLRYYRDFMSDAPNEVSCYALMVHVPPAAPFPSEHHGAPALALVACHSGPLEKGREALRALEGVGTPILQATEPMPYAALQGAFDAGFPNGQRYYWKSCYLDSLSEEAIDTLVDAAGDLPGPYTAVFLEAMGGAISRVPPSSTAFPHRQASFNLTFAPGWTEPRHDEQYIDWARTAQSRMAPYSTGGVYANYLDRDDGDRAPAAYGENLQRLRELKARFDPQGLFGGAASLASKAPDGRPAAQQ